MSKISFIIPSRNEKFLNKTILDILKNCKGEFEIIVILDGYWEYPIDDPRIVYLHKGSPEGMRPAINDGVAISTGEYILKIDAHCMLDEGFDVKLIEHHGGDNWVQIPRRKRLDADNWCIQDVGKIDIDYEFLCAPTDEKDWGGPSLHGKQWNNRTRERVGKPEYMIDDQMSFQGSCWFMKKDFFYWLELMDHERYGTFWNEAQEIGLKTWLSGGRVVVNKHTWYAHLHKGRKHGRGYNLDSRQLYKGAEQTTKWIGETFIWHKQKRPFSWIIEHFWPVPTWPDDFISFIQDYERKRNS